MAVDIGSSTVSLTWLPPTEPNGILLFYRVVATEVGDHSEDTFVDLPAKMSTSAMVQVTPNSTNGISMTSMAQDLPKESISVAFALRGLSPHTDYVITVVANTSAGYGNKSEELHIWTAADIIGDCISILLKSQVG